MTTTRILDGIRALVVIILGISTIKNISKYNSKRVATGIPRAQTEIRRHINGIQLIKLSEIFGFSSLLFVSGNVLDDLILVKYHENKSTAKFLIIEKTILLPAATSVYPVVILRKDIIAGIRPNATTSAAIATDKYANFLLHLLFDIGRSRRHIIALW